MLLLMKMEITCLRSRRETRRDRWGSDGCDFEMRTTCTEMHDSNLKQSLGNIEVVRAMDMGERKRKLLLELGIRWRLHLTLDTLAASAIC